MEKTDRMRALEDAYDCDIFVLLREKYNDEEYTQHELAAEFSARIGAEIPRSTLSYWLRESGASMGRRALSDVQRITIMALLPHFSNRSIAKRVGCGKRTVARYRREVARHGEPIELSETVEVTARDRRVLVPPQRPRADTTVTADPGSATITDPTVSVGHVRRVQLRADGGVSETRRI